MHRNNLIYQTAQLLENKYTNLFKSAEGFDCRYFTEVTNFNIEVTEPENSRIRIIFEIDDELFYFNDGRLDDYKYDGNLDDILLHGNSIADIVNLRDLPFAGKVVKYRVAMENSNEEVLPHLKISVNAKSFADVYQVTNYSPIFELNCNARIINILETQTTTGHATAITEARIKTLSGWSEWQTFAAWNNRVATAIQFRTKYTLSTLDGTDKAEINSLVVNYTTDYTKSASDFVEIVTTPQEFTSNLNICYALIKYKNMEDCDIKAYISFADPVERFENIYCGSGNDITIDKTFAQDSMAVILNETPIFDYYYSTADKVITFDNEDIAPVHFSFDTAFVDDWVEMPADYIKNDSARFIYSGFGKKVAAAKFVITKKSGDVAESFTATDAGYYTRVLEHSNITDFKCSAPYELTPPVVRILAGYDEEITYSYKWCGTCGEVEGYIVSFAV